MSKTNMMVAETILSQLGGSGRLTAMLGAKNFMGDTDSLSFRFSAPAKNKANYVKITLDASDLYTLEFHKIHGLNVTAKGETLGLDVSQLRATFESATHLRLSL